ncbi:TMhelix containing protein [Vibrio phage 1.121.O._10N.286.46.C4]|nr:TMhelix containing protein [Vibrio phage 1.121.O._10N.286.46.C4]
MKEVGDALLLLVGVFAVFLFWGEPDVHDLVLQYLQKY